VDSYKWISFEERAQRQAAEARERRRIEKIREEAEACSAADRIYKERLKVMATKREAVMEQKALEKERLEDTRRRQAAHKAWCYGQKRELRLQERIDSLETVRFASPTALSCRSSPNRLPVCVCLTLHACVCPAGQSEHGSRNVRHRGEAGLALPRLRGSYQGLGRRQTSHTPGSPVEDRFATGLPHHRRAQGIPPSEPSDQAPWNPIPTGVC